MMSGAVIYPAFPGFFLLVQMGRGWGGSWHQPEVFACFNFSNFKKYCFYRDFKRFFNKINDNYKIFKT